MTADAPIDVEIGRLGAQGDGVADTADGPRFVPFALPGERWRLASNAAPECLVPRPDRAPARCPHFHRCGGCVAQSMSEPLYRDWKRRIVVDAFAHRGLEPEVAELERVPELSRRRAVLTARRRGGSIDIGFNRMGTNDVEPMAACAVLVPQIVAALPALAETAAMMMPSAGKEQTVRMTVLGSDSGLAVDIAGAGRKPDAALRARLAAAAERARFAEVSLEGDVVVSRSPPRLTMSGVAVTVPPTAFVQAVGAAEARLASLIVEGTGKARRVADLFCGLGPFSLALARRAKVLAIDSESTAVAALAAAARHATGLKPIETRTRDLFREPLARKELEGIDAVVLDPPRAGAQAQAEMLARSTVPSVVMVSCNPATMARDCRILVDAGFRLGTVTPVDQFLYAPHVEAVAVLER